MATNSLGFKDAAPRPVVLKPNKHRLLFIGDSFTEGVGVPYGETFVGLIAEQLAQKDIGVLNAGVCSYSPAIYYAKTKYLLEKKGLVFNELIVYIDLSDIINEAAIYDIDQGGWVQATPQREKEIEQLAELFYESKKAERSLYQRLEKALERDTVITYLLVKECHDAFFPREIRWDYDSLHLYGPRWTIDKDLEDEFAAAGLQECAHNMDKLYALCKAHGIRLTVAVYPWPDQILHNDLNSRQVAFWRRWAEAHDVQLINHFPQFVSKNSTTAEVRRILDAYFIPGDLHWNAAGHRLIAAHFLDVFQPFN
ncbi:MAG: SGNH/GDSL hydrolase family protein [Thermodesulfobacteriota bacterium]|nr:SGNH/GDSL hydrolase family protein [Thermodesulfobacteriota bacterium]